MTARPIEYRKYNQIKFYYGIVQKVLGEDDSDENYDDYKGKYIIQFRIPDIIDNLNDDEWPLAHPIMKHTSQVFKGDNVLIMQLDTDLQDFVYFSNDISESTGIRYKNCIITLANDEFGDDADSSLTIDVVKLKDAEDDQHEPEDVEQVHSRILVNEKSISLKTVGKDKDIGDSCPYSTVMVSQGDNADEKATTIETKGDSTSSKIVFQDQKTELTVGNGCKMTLDDQGKTISIELSQGNKLTFDGNQNTWSLTDGTQNKFESSTTPGGTTLRDTVSNKRETGVSGIKDSSMLQSNMELGALISMNNMIGGVASMISDIWAEMTTMATNLLTLASACAAIQFVGPGALTNGTAAAVPGCASSIGTIAAKMALSKTIAK